MSTTTQVQTVRQLELGKDILLARFVKHIPDGRYRLRAQTEVTVKGKAIAGKHVSSPYITLLPTEIREVLNEGMRPIDRLIDGLQSYPIVGLKGLTETALELFVPRWEEAQATLIAARQEVSNRWGEVEEYNYDAWEQVLGIDYSCEVVQRLERLRDELNYRYSVEYDLWKPPEPVDVALGSPVVQKWLREGRDHAEQAVEAALLEFVTGPRDALVKAAEEMITTLIDPKTKVIKPSTFTAFRAAMDKLRSLKEISDVTLIEQINNMEDQLEAVVGDAEAVGAGFTAVIKAKAGELVGGIDQVIAAAQDQGAREGVLAAFGRGGRAIELD